MSAWTRVNRANHCPICDNDSWCIIAPDGGAVLCMRVASEMPKQLKSGETGYIHRLTEAHEKPNVPFRKIEKPEVQIDCEAMMNRWADNTPPERLGQLATGLHVKSSALLELRVAWAAEHRAWAFPMREASGKMCGIRLRADDGKKWCVTGSKTGVFMPWCEPEQEVWLPEGPTDVAALRSLNLYAIGRPSNSGGALILKQLIEKHGIKRAVILADNDEDKEVAGRKFNPGMDGAESLSRNLPIPCCEIMLPVKDVREFVSCGGTQELLESMKNQMVWRNV